VFVTGNPASIAKHFAGVDVVGKPFLMTALVTALCAARCG
jgi:hypothetical protein